MRTEARTVAQTRTKAPRVEADQTALLVPLDDIRLGTNARKDWDRLDDSFKSFIESVQEQGILEPLLVREVSSGSGAGGREFLLVAGYRRYAAARSLNLPRVPVRVLAASDDEALSVTLMENLAREGLSEADALRAVEALQDTYGWGVRRIARATGRTAGWISALLTVARSGPERAAVEQGRIGIETAVRLARLKEPFPEARQTLLARLEAGQAVQIQDVPRLRHLQSADGEAPAAPLPPLPPPVRSGEAEEGDALTVVGAAPAGRDGTAGEPAAGASLEVELAQTERSLVRNLRLVTRQVLSSLVAAWTEQGPERVLPESVRQDLRQVRQDISDVLERPAVRRAPDR